MGKIKKITENELVGGTQNTDVYPVTSVKAVYDENNERLDHILNRRGVVNVSTNYNDDHIAEVLTLNQAIAKVPSSDRVLGFRMTFLSPDGWVEYQYSGDSITNWNDINYWNNYVNSTMVSQEIGDSESKVMSQRALQDSLGLIYPEFSASKNYRAGYVVSYNGHLYEFTEEYIGEWNDSKVKPFTPNSKYSKVPYHSLYKAQNSVTIKVDRAIKELWLSPNIHISDRNNIILGNVSKEHTSQTGTNLWRILLYDASTGSATVIESFLSKRKENSLEIIKSSHGSYVLIDWREVPVGEIVSSIDHTYKVDIDYVSDINNFPILREYIKTENYDEISAYANKVYYHSLTVNDTDKTRLLNKIVKEVYLSKEVAALGTVSIGNIRKAYSYTAEKPENIWQVITYNTSAEGIVAPVIFTSVNKKSALELIKGTDDKSYILIDWTEVEDGAQLFATTSAELNLNIPYVSDINNFPIIKHHIDVQNLSKEQQNLSKEITDNRLSIDKSLYHNIFAEKDRTSNVRNRINKAIKELWINPSATINITDRANLCIGNVSRNITAPSGSGIWRVVLYDSTRVNYFAATITFNSVNKKGSLELLKSSGNDCYVLIDWSEIKDGETVVSEISAIYNVDIDYVSDINNFPVIKHHIDVQNIKPKIDLKEIFKSNFNVPAISWVDDDFNLTSTPKIKAICDEVGCKCDFAYIPTSSGGTGDYPTDAKYSIPEETLEIIKQYELEGFHIEMHPIHKGWYSSASAGEYQGRAWVEQSLVKTIRCFKENGILNSSCIIYPGASGVNAEAINMASCHVEYGINAGGSSNYNDGVHNKFSLNRLFISFTSSHTKTWYKSVIDEAVSKGAWLILGTHGYEFNDSGTVDETSKSLANLKEVIQYANEKCAISPISQVFKKRKPMLDLYLST